ncbi:MAG: hypothetical protein ACYC26_12500 [Phycisphaerales bacterium]
MKSILLLACVLTFSACADGTRDLSPDTLPDPFDLTFAMRSTDGRATHYRITPDAGFHFSGGVGAYAGAATPIGKLTDAQRLQVWRWLVDHNLLRAAGPMFARPQVVQYDLQLHAGSHHNRLTVVDPAPGSPDSASLAQLNAILFGFQADIRYGQVIRPIEVELEKRKR